MAKAYGKVSGLGADFQTRLMKLCTGTPRMMFTNTGARYRTIHPKNGESEARVNRQSNRKAFQEQNQPLKLHFIYLYNCICQGIH
jgi:hypothetical protein